MLPSQKLVLLAVENQLDYNLVKIEEKDLSQLFIKKYLILDENNKIIVNKNKETEVDSQFVEKYREIFKGIRKNSKGRLAEVKKKLKKLFSEESISKEEVLELAKYHVKYSKYPRNAGNFLYKLVKEEKMQYTITPLLDLKEELKNDYIKQQTFNKLI